MHKQLVGVSMFADMSKSHTTEVKVVGVLLAVPIETGG